MEAKKTVVQKEVVVTKLVDETNVILTLTEEEAGELRILSYTVKQELVKNKNTTAYKVFKGLYDTLVCAGVKPATHYDCNFRQDFREVR